MNILLFHNSENEKISNQNLPKKSKYSQSCEITIRDQELYIGPNPSQYTNLHQNLQQTQILIVMFIGFAVFSIVLLARYSGTELWQHAAAVREAACIQCQHAGAIDTATGCGAPGRHE